MHPLITSPHNPKIKNILLLEKARERRDQNVFTVEGIKELTLAREAGYEFQTVYFCPDIISADELAALQLEENILIPVQENVFAKIAYRESTGGVIAIAQQKKHLLNDIELPENPLLLIIEAVEKPGNLGALLRTADAAKVDAVIICDPQTDFYNPNVIRASIGCVFTNQLASASSAEAIEWLRSKKIRIYCTYLQASKPYYEQNYTIPCAIVMGTEATGLSPLWVESSDANIVIPMSGKIDSMNVSTAAAVIIFEARRQRNFS